MEHKSRSRKREPTKEELMEFVFEARDGVKMVKHPSNPRSTPKPCTIRLTGTSKNGLLFWKPRRYIRLPEVEAIVSGSAGFPTPVHPDEDDSCFAIVTPHRCLFLQAASYHQREMWTVGLSRILRVPLRLSMSRDPSPYPEPPEGAEDEEPDAPESSASQSMVEESRLHRTFSHDSDISDSTKQQEEAPEEEAGADADETKETPDAEPATETQKPLSVADFLHSQLSGAENVDGLVQSILAFAVEPEPQKSLTSLTPQDNSQQRIWMIVSASLALWLPLLFVFSKISRWWSGSEPPSGTWVTVMWWFGTLMIEGGAGAVAWMLLKPPQTKPQIPIAGTLALAVALMACSVAFVQRVS